MKKQFFTGVIVAGVTSAPVLATQIHNQAVPSHFAEQQNLLHQEMQVVPNAEGTFELNFDDIPPQCLGVTLKSGNEIVAEITTVNGAVVFKASGDHNFSFRGSTKLKGLRLAAKGNVTFENTLGLSGVSTFDVEGKCLFKGGVILDDPKAFLLTSTGEYVFQGSSLLSNLVGSHKAQITISQGSALETNNLFVQKNHTASLRNNGGLTVSDLGRVGGRFSAFSTGAKSQTNIGKFLISSQTMVHRGKLTFDEGTLKAPAIKCMGSLEGKSLDLVESETNNTGTIKVDHLRGIQGKFQNSQKGTLDVQEKFIADFAQYRDFGTSYFRGLAHIKAKKGWFSGTLEAHAMNAYMSEYLFVHKNTDLEVQKHITLASGGDQDLEGRVNVRFSKPKASLKSFSKSTRASINRMKPGAFFSAKKDLKYRGQVRSTNSSVILQAGEKYSEVGSKVEAGLFKENDVYVFATHAELAGEARSHNSMIVQADSATLEGKRVVDETLKLNISEVLEQLENDLLQAKLVLANARRLNLAGTVGGQLVASGKDSKLSGTFEDDVNLQSDTALLDGSFSGATAVKSDKTTLKTKEAKKMMVQGKEGKDSGTLTIEGNAKVEDLSAQVNQVNFKEDSKLEGRSRSIDAKKIVHKKGSQQKATGAVFENADEELVFEKDSHSQAGSHDLVGKKVIDDGHIESVKSSGERGSTNIEAHESMIVGPEGKVTSQGSTYAKVGHQKDQSWWDWGLDFVGYNPDFKNEGKWEAETQIFDIKGTFFNTGSIHSRKDLSVTATNTMNLFGGSLGAGSKASINADILSLSFGANLSGRDVVRNSLINLSVGSVNRGTRSFTENATLLNASLLSLNMSRNYTSNSLINVSEMTLLTGLPMSWSIPGASVDDWWDRDKAWYEQGILSTAASFAGGVVGGNFGKVVSGVQIVRGAFGAAKSAKDLLTTPMTAEGKEFRLSDFHQKFGSALSTAMSIQSSYKGVKGLYDDAFGETKDQQISENQTETPHEKQDESTWQQRLYETSLATFGPSATINSIWNYGGAVTGYNWYATGHVNHNNFSHYDYSSTAALTKTVTTHAGEDMGGELTWRFSYVVSGDFRVGGKKSVADKISANIDRKLTLDKNLKARAGKDVSLVARDTLTSEDGSFFTSGGEAKYFGQNSVQHNGDLTAKSKVTVKSDNHVATGVNSTVTSEENSAILYSEGTTDHGGVVSAPKGNAALIGDQGVKTSKGSGVYAGEALSDSVPNGSESSSKEEAERESIGHATIQSKGNIEHGGNLSSTNESSLSSIKGNVTLKTGSSVKSSRGMASVVSGFEEVKKEGSGPEDQPKETTEIIEHHDVTVTQEKDADLRGAQVVVQTAGSADLDGKIQAFQGEVSVDQQVTPSSEVDTEADNSKPSGQDPFDGVSLIVRSGDMAVKGTVEADAGDIREVAGTKETKKLLKQQFKKRILKLRTLPNPGKKKLKLREYLLEPEKIFF